MIGLGGARHIKSLGDNVKLAFGGVEPSAAIGNGHQWASFAFAHRAAELEYYGNHMEDLFDSTLSKFLSTVLRYDEHIRKEAAQQGQFSLNAPAGYMHLYTQYFTQVRAGVESGMTGNSAEFGAGGAPRQGHRGQSGCIPRDETCNQWNGGKDCNESTCIF